MQTLYQSVGVDLSQKANLYLLFVFVSTLTYGHELLGGDRKNDTSSWMKWGDRAQPEGVDI